MDGRVHLVLPNHPSYMDPLLLFADCVDAELCPLVDEKFFRHPLSRWFMHQVGAVEVPDLMVHRDRAALAQAASLTQVALNALSAGTSLVIYPSGHVSLTGKEHLGARRLAYELLTQLPEGVEVLLVRTRGMEDSHFSHSRHPRWCFRRHLYVEVAPMTSTLLAWAKESDKLSFNAHLEDWYNR